MYDPLHTSPWEKICRIWHLLPVWLNFLIVFIIIVMTLPPLLWLYINYLCWFFTVNRIVMTLPPLLWLYINYLCWFFTVNR